MEKSDNETIGQAVPARKINCPPADSSASATNQFQFAGLIALIDSMTPGVIFQDHAGIIQFANPSAEQILGLPLDRLQSLTLTDAAWKTIFRDGTDVTVDQHPTTLALRTGQPVKGVVLGILHPQNNQYRWIEIDAVPVFLPAQNEPYQVFSIFTDITDRIRTEAELRRSNASYRLIAENTEDVIWVLDVETQGFTYVSPSVFKLRGYTPKEVLQQTMMEVLTPESAQKAAASLETNLPILLAREPTPSISVELDQLRKDGSIVTTEVTSRLAFDDAGKPQVIGISRDATERKQAQEKLRRSEEANRAILNATIDSVFLIDLDGIILLSNETGARRLGRTSADLVGTNIYALLPPEVARFRRAKADLAVQTRQAVSFEDSRPGIVFLNSIYPIIDPDGQITRLAIYGRDITEIRLNARAFQETADRLNQAQKIAHIGSWELDIQKNVLHWSDEIYRIFDLQPQEFKATYEAFLFAIHPDDREAVDRAYTTSLATRQPYKIVHRLLLKDGAIKYVQEQCETSFDPDGRPLRSLGTVQDITERVQAEERLRQSQVRLDLAVKGANAGLWDWNIPAETLTINDRWATMLGYTIEELEPVSIHTWERLCHPDDLLNNQLHLRQHFTGERDFYEIETRMKHKNGEWVWVLTSGQVTEWDPTGKPMRMNGTHIDVTQRKLAEQALAASEEKYRLLSKELEQRVIERTAEVQDLYDNAPAGYHSQDTSGGFQMINQTELNWLGYSRDEVVGKMKITDILTPESTRRFKAQMPAFISQGLINDFEVDLVCKDGSIMPTVMNARAVFNQDGKYLGNRATLTDNTERKKAQDALRESEKSLRRSRDELSIANAALEKASRLKDEFLASMSHELRTPLTGILGLSEVLQLRTYGALNEKQLNALKNIETSGRHLLDLINDILDLSKIEADKLELQIEPCPVAEICQASLQLIKGMAHQKGLMVSFLANPISAVVRADPRRLKQMLVNLLSNAVKFTLEGGSLGLEVTGSPENQTIDFAVWDTGIGIPAEDMGRLFRPFVQLDSSLSRQYTGTGLGLSLVSRLAEMHSGSVRVESKVGEGSRFTITLPWAATDHIQAAAPQTRQINIQRCLLIEDNELHQKQISGYLKSLRIETIIYNHGDGAQDAAMRVRPDVILLDLNLPDISGKEVLKQLKSDPRTAQIVVVISSVVEDRNTCLSLGAAGYLLKPFTLEDMTHELAKIVIPQPEAAVPAENVPFRGTVLLADDNPVILNTLTDFLETNNYSMYTARNGHELVELAETCNPDIILADIQMPGLDGLQAIQQIRASGNAKLSRLPIVAITALAMPGDEEKCMAAGANQYMSKPVSLEKLLALISNLIEASQEV